MAEFERELVQERAQEGRLKAMERGTKFGPKARLNEAQLESLRREYDSPNCNCSELAARYSISRSSAALRFTAL